MSQELQEKTRTKEELSSELFDQFKKFRGKILDAKSIGRQNEEYTVEALSRILLGKNFNLPKFRKKKQKKDFYRNFITEIIKTFAEDGQDGAPLLLAMNGLLPGYENLSCTDCCSKYYYESGFKKELMNPYDSFQKTYEKKAINSMVPYLVEEITINQSMELINIAQKVLNELLGDTLIDRKDGQKSKENDDTELSPCEKVEKNTEGQLTDDNDIQNNNSIVDDTKNGAILSDGEDNHEDDEVILQHPSKNGDIKEKRPLEDSEFVTELIGDPKDAEGDDELLSVTENNTSADSCVTEDTKSDEELSSDDYEIELTKKPIGGVTDEADTQNGDSIIDNTQNEAIASGGEDSYEDDGAETPHHISKDDNIEAEQSLKGSENSESATEPATGSEGSVSEEELSSTTENGTSDVPHVPTKMESEKKLASLDDSEGEIGDKPIDEPFSKRAKNNTKRLICAIVAIAAVSAVSILGIIWHNNYKPAKENIKDTFDPESIAEERVVMPGWGDSDGGRPSYTASEVEYGKLGNQTVLNSINGKYRADDYGAFYVGDERDFVKVWCPNTNPDDDSSWESEYIVLEDEDSYMVKLYVSNNTPKQYAEDTRVALRIPSYSDKQIPVRGYIESSNATPSKYWDSVVFVSDDNKPFHLEFRSNTAMLHNDSIGADGLQLSDDIVTKAAEGGILIGYDDLDGKIPGGSEYSSEVTAWINVIHDPYGIDLKVRKLGDEEWNEMVSAEIGDKVEFQLEFSNANSEIQTNVMIRDVLPGNLKYVPGTTKLYNSNYPNWATLSPDGDIVTRGVNIGSYLGSDDGQNGGNAFVRFTAEVVDTDLVCGENYICNWSRASVDNSVLENPAIVIVQKPEQ